MERKDKRSLALSLVIGDGNLHIYKNYGRLTIDHGLQQSDYQTWKGQLLSNIFDKDVKLRSGHKGKSIQVQIGDNRFKAWYKFIYTNKKKDISKILPFIRHPEFTLAVWLMDDGYVEPSLDKRYPDKIYSARFRIFTNDQSIATQNVIMKWFKDNFDVELKIKWVKDKKQNKSYPYLKMSCEDSLKLWGTIRDFVLQFKSMTHKFRHIEKLYQYRVIQRIPGHWQNYVND